MLFSRRPSHKLVIVIDAQSSAIRGSLVLMPQPAGAPSILLSASRDIPYKPQAGSGYLIKAALKVVAEIIHEILKRSPHKISAVHYALSSPWIISQAKTISLDFKEETEITRGRILSLVSEERDRLAHSMEKSVEIVEEKISGIRLNGYSVAAWQNKRARHIDVSYIMSVAGTVMMRRFRETCHPAVPENRVSFHSSMLLLSASSAEPMHDRPSYALVHAHDELTDVAVVEHGIPVFFGSYPIGAKSVIRKVARATRTDLAAAESLLDLYGSGDLVSAHREKMDPVIGEISLGWSSELRKLAPALPPDILLLASSQSPFFLKGLKDAHPHGRVDMLSGDDTLSYASAIGSLAHHHS